MALPKLSILIRLNGPIDSGAGAAMEELVIYELHVGTFTAEGTFNAVIERLPYLLGLGITAIELMPLADFPGKRNWGYDGVNLFAPAHIYGRPDDLPAGERSTSLGLGRAARCRLQPFGARW